MGQKLSSQPSGPLVWILRGQPKLHPNPEQPIKFQYKTRRKITGNCNNDNITSIDDDQSNKFLRKTISTPLLTSGSGKLPSNQRKNALNPLNVIGLNSETNKIDGCGYDIEDIDQFLAKASIERPANIPVVLSVSTLLYQTRVGGYQVEIALPLGMVVNAVFRNQHWLYAQTPHGEEGYIVYTACIPLGIIPSVDDSMSPCWETSTDVFPRPSGNLTDTISTRSECSSSTRRCRSKTKNKSKRRRRTTVTTSSGNDFGETGESNVDELYLRAASAASTINIVRRHTLLVVDEDYIEEGQNTVSVRKGEVVTLLSAHLKGWFWIRRNEGEEGFIPAAVAGYGYL